MFTTIPSLLDVLPTKTYTDLGVGGKKLGRCVLLAAPCMKGLLQKHSDAWSAQYTAVMSEFAEVLTTHDKEIGVVMKDQGAKMRAMLDLRRSNAKRKREATSDGDDGRPPEKKRCDPEPELAELRARATAAESQVAQKESQLVELRTRLAVKEAQVVAHESEVASLRTALALLAECV
jgi:hypothetical protein